MNTSTLCPCCSTRMLHHFSDRREYWFCRHCWSEMPTSESEPMSKSYRKSRQNSRIINLSSKLDVSRIAA